jgi:predicted dehydrogenase
MMVMRSVNEAIPNSREFSPTNFEDLTVLCRMLEIAFVIVMAWMILSPERAAAGERANVSQPVGLRAGIIGLDTSHVVAFTQLLNAPDPKPELAGVRVVAAFPGGSPDVPSSRDRLAGFTRDLREKFGVTITGSIDELLSQVDVVLLESVDGRPHLEQARPVFQAHKPVFIDKPVAGTLADAIAIFELARETKTPCFSSSSLRFSPNVLAMRHHPKVGNVLGCDAYGPCHLEEHHPDLYWYGVHGVEALYTIMGTGCQTVARTQTDGTELVVGVWAEGRIGTFRGLRRGHAGYGATVFGSNGIAPAGNDAGYEPLVVEIVKFFKTGKPPVSAEETLEIFAFMEAADESKRQGGMPVAIESVMAKARAQSGK